MIGARLEKAALSQGERGERQAAEQDYGERETGEKAHSNRRVAKWSAWEPSPRPAPDAVAIRAAWNAARPSGADVVRTFYAALTKAPATVSLESFRGEPRRGLRLGIRP